MILSKQISFNRPMRLVSWLTVVGLFLSGCGEKKPRVYRVGIISGGEAFASIADGFKATMTELGYIENKNIIYDLQKLNSDLLGEKHVVRKFVQDRVDLIFAFPTEPALAAKEATQGTNIPVVFALAGVEGTGLVETVHHPGGNITGVRFPGPESTAKRLDILHELVPQAKRVYLIYDPNYPNVSSALGQLHPAASSLGITLVEDPVNNLEELRAALQKRAKLTDIGIDAILIMPEILTHSPDGFRAVLKFAKQHKVPIAGGMNFTADLGAMFSLAPDNFEMGSQAAILADKILKGTPAGSLMVVTPQCYLRLNYKAIQELGLKVSEGLLTRADEVIR
ncbi:MAG: ABC transporter substrate-binding protein [candidate division KSB1 bacterium]|nr:ABC transporter substrate-binding protein [candidate division KSB1 bacterium]